ncbi:MAG: DNA polymerase III subunit gamma/tau [Chloroflexi bacterium]|nr:DNA polymerase III subunit gamma/tau [Chloroflexota bacterium]
MLSESLYRRWRSRRFSEVVGQDHVTRTLQNALRSGRFAHAYLFCGPRGVGKTTMARLLAKTVNCSTPVDGEPCNVCEMCRAIDEGRAVDLVEIDAASNNSVDDIRDLREKVHFVPTQAKYKVYIVDEVHMLSTSAFNALLKTLEEPPPHVIFALATTEVHKIPATVLSRCQRFDLRRITLTSAIRRLAEICEQEGFQVERPALELIGRSAGGSLRDAESLLDQLAAYSAGATVTVDFVRALLGIPSSEQIAALVDSLISRDVASGLEIINQVLEDGTDVRQFSRELVNYLRGLMLLKAGSSGAGLLDVTKEVRETMCRQAEALALPQVVDFLRLFCQIDYSLRNSAYGQLPLELAFVEAVLPRRKTTEERVISSPAERPRPVPQPPIRLVTVSGNQGRDDRPQPVPVTETPEQPVAPSDSVPPAEREATTFETSPEGNPDLERIKVHWPAIVDDMRPLNRSIEALLRSCEPVAVDNGFVVLGFYYEFHKSKIEDAKNRDMVERVMSKVVGSSCRVRCTMIERGRSAQTERAGTEKAASESPRVSAAKNIFNARKVDLQ